ncbi:phosphopantetheine-binding protein, partial [Micromonospora sp. NPDC047074]|uniref:phosphopantetheine-binding protein n=1 Tax=Micromonospora sp. NPDC047074 TaxID=3154339 RepID=UPI0034054755
VPHSIIALPHFPLTRNGKIDRTALPTPDTTTHSAPPADTVQRQLAEIWATVLGTTGAGIGVHDDFFALGGHSLLATQVTAQAGAAFEVELPVAALFRDPTIAGLAGELRRVERRPGWVDSVAVLREAVAALTEDEARRALAAASRPDQPYDRTGAPR